MEIPNNNPPEYMMDFKKFTQSVKKLIYSDEKVFIKGKYKEIGNKEVFSGDDFQGNIVHSSGKKVTAEEIYKTYLEWFNRTLKTGEKEREFVSAEIIKKEVRNSSQN